MQCFICNKEVFSDIVVPESSGLYGNYIFSNDAGRISIQFALCDHHLAKHGSRFPLALKDISHSKKHSDLTEDDFQWIASNSSVIREFAYSSQHETLGLNVSGKKYLYFNISFDLYQQFLAAPSLGRFYSSHIKVNADGSKRGAKRL